MGSFFFLSLRVHHIPCADMTDEMLKYIRITFLETPLLWVEKGEFNAYSIINASIYKINVCFLLPVR